MDQKIQWSLSPRERALVVCGLQTAINVYGKADGPVAMVEQCGPREVVNGTVELLNNIEPAAIVPLIRLKNELPLDAKPTTPVLTCDDAGLLEDVRRFVQDLDAKDYKPSDLYPTAFELLRRVHKSIKTEQVAASKNTTEVAEQTLDEPRSADGGRVAEFVAPSDGEVPEREAEAAAVVDESPNSDEPAVLEVGEFSGEAMFEAPE